MEVAYIRPQPFYAFLLLGIDGRGLRSPSRNWAPIGASGASGATGYLEL